MGVAGSSPLAVKRSPFPRCAESAAASETAPPPAERPRRGGAPSGSTGRLGRLHSACLLVLFACRMAARVRLAPWFGFALIWVGRAALRPNRGKASAANRRRPSKTRQGAPPGRVARNRRLRAGRFAAARSHGRSVCRTINGVADQQGSNFARRIRMRQGALAMAEVGMTNRWAPGETIQSPVMRFETRK